MDPPSPPPPGPSPACKPGQSPITWDAQHSGGPPGTGSVQLSFSLPPCSPALTDKFIPAVRGQMSPFIRDATRPTRPLARVRCCRPGRGLRGVGDVWPCHPLPAPVSHPSPIPAPSARLHWLSATGRVTGGERRTGGG